MGQAGRNLTVTCDYNIEYKKHRKWWCRKTVLMHCHNRVHTTGAEQVVRKNRVTIRDDQGQHRFTVTMERLRDNDAGTYWCGVDTDKFDLAFPVRVTIAPATGVPPEPLRVLGSHPAPAYTFPSSHYLSQSPETGPMEAQEEVSYAHLSLRPRDPEPIYANADAETTGTEQVVRKDLVTIRDDQTQRRFTVSMECLRHDDVGMYWSLLSSVQFLLLVFLKVPLLLFLMGALVWASWPQRGPRKQT
ncbi:CMRF35-like molecule 6 [Sorex araneus]|uniref:CMRF35-like molecule 6 n=1 Tax=Sorex araneus TaxID=42254 RepID=UPI0024336A12|nr:CMRF35-like molecule 6 [Sorex araneus]